MTERSHPSTSPDGPPRWVYAVVLLSVALLAAGLRFYRLPELPLGLHYDEAANAALVAEIASGESRPIFISSYTGKEVFFFYAAAALSRVLGAGPLAGPLAMRLGSALLGTGTVLATAWATRELLGSRRGATWVALLAAAFVATSFWHLLFSRYGFRAISQPLLQALTVAALWRGLRQGRWPWFALAGALCGLTAYTYLAARLFPIPLALALGVWFVGKVGNHAGNHQGHQGHEGTGPGILYALRVLRGKSNLTTLRSLAVFGGTAALVLAPLASYWLAHPGSFGTRIGQVAPASWSAVWQGISACLGMLFLRGDPYIRFNLPGRPLFDPLTAAFFLLGVGGVVRELVARRPGLARPGAVLLLGVGVVMLLPSALATGEIIPSNLRAIGLLPFVYVFPALGVWTAVDRLWRWRRPHAEPAPLLWAGVCLLLLGSTGLATARTYFGRWAGSTALYEAADGDLVGLARYLNEAGTGGTTVYVAAVHYRHPTLAALARDYSAIKWLVGGRTAVVPAQGQALLLVPRSVDRAWYSGLLPASARLAVPPGPDRQPAFDAYRLDESLPLTPSLAAGADFGHVIALTGYSVEGTPRAGETATLQLYWRVLNPPSRPDYQTALHLADAWGSWWGEAVPFQYPAEQWAPGERIVDRLSVPVAPGAPPGTYTLRVEQYAPADRLNLPLLGADGQFAGTAAELPVSIGRAPAGLPVDGLGIRQSLDLSTTGGFTLLGANLDTVAARPGEPVYLALFWRADRSAPDDGRVQLRCGDLLLYDGAPVHGSYPTGAWTAGELVADRYALYLPRTAPAGHCSLRLAVARPDGAPLMDEVELGTLEVQTVERSFGAPPLQHPVGAVLGGQVALLGYDLSAERLPAGETLVLTLYWQALQELESSYTVFTHLQTSGGTTAGQHDALPANGTYPTPLWMAGEVVVDRHAIVVDPAALPGPATLAVGLYLPSNGERLPVDGASTDTLVLQTVHVE